MADLPEELTNRFPDLRPIPKLPTLHTVNGIGTTLYGRRDFDEETGTYIATQYFAFLFVPLFALAAYRVADAGGGAWYFIGREPLSRAARRLNWFSLSALVGLALFLGGLAYVGSDHYKVGRRLAQADEMVQEGQAGRAAEVYRDVLIAGGSHAEAARGKLQALVETPPASAAEAAAVFGVAVELHRRDVKLVPDLFAHALATARQLDDDPRKALEIVEAAAPLAPRPQDHLRVRRTLLEQLVEREPDNVELASRLAVVYEALDERQRCEKLLARHEKKLGTLQGAAILGRLYAAGGKHDRAFALLDPFVEGRLPRLRAAETAYTQAVQTAQNRVLEELKSNKAPGFDYERWKSSSEAQRREMVGSYLDGKVRDDPGLRTAVEALRGQAAVVPAALDLGLVRLQRAQAMANPAARKAELEAAEKTFLAVRGLAGQTGQYRLTLGQVYYWLGKHAEGRQLFDELLKAEQRSTDMLLSVARVLREVGAAGEARKLAEEAHGKEKDTTKKQQAAMMRALLYTDIDDEITWLQRCDTQDRNVRASLCTTRGHKALRAGADDEAARHYREAIALYEKMPETASVLNNGALAHFGLYHATHEREQFSRAVDKLDRAIALLPGDSILLHNAASTVLDSAVQDVVGSDVDLKVLKRSGWLGLLNYLYRDPAGRRALVARLRKHPGTVKVRGYLDKLLILAPKRADAYSLLAELEEEFGDETGLKDLRRRLATVELDQEHARAELLDYYAGKNDEKKRDELKKGLARQEGVLEAARRKGGATRAVAATMVAQTKMGGEPLLGAVDADEVVKLAQEAHEAAPSSATRGTLIGTLIFRAHGQLKKSDPAYAALARRCERSLGATLVRHVSGGPKSALRDKVAAHADVVRAAALTAELIEVLPDQVGPSAWALLRSTRPDDAARAARLVQADRVGEAKHAIDRALSPLSATLVLGDTWRLRLAGKDGEADALLREAAKRGVPLPVGP